MLILGEISKTKFITRKYIISSQISINIKKKSLFKSIKSP